MTDLNPANLSNSNILLWTNAKLPNSFILKMKDKRYLGLVRKDCQGVSYWVFKEINKKRNQSEKLKDYVHNSNPSKE
jgi:hypothetical protein